MSPITTACCAVTLNQQQQTHINHCKSLAAENSVSSMHTKQKYCTIVENGRVVVKPIAHD
jgi:hypothetical protein